MFLTIVLVVFLAMCAWKLLEGVGELASESITWSKYNPLLWVVALIMYPFIWLSERHLPKKERTPFF
jgi:hypothetical protein